MDHIRCTSCNKQIVPRLWHYHRWFLPSLHYMRTQFICPFCGHVLYEKGGRMTLMGKIIVGFILLFLANAMSAVMAGHH